MLGVGDYYYELAVQIVEIGLKTRAQNGGILDFVDLKQRLERMRQSQSLSECAFASFT
jgi:ESCRT-II complex subunit VPS22